MNDKEKIISALKQCSSGKAYACVECPYVALRSPITPNRCLDALHEDCINLINGYEEEKYYNTIDIFVRDKITGIIHKVGEDGHDSLWVDSDGTVHFHNLQNGDGCGANSIIQDKESCGYEFCPSDYGRIDRDYYIEHENDYEEYEKKRRKTNE